jgi:hypothetical protein
MADLRITNEQIRLSSGDTPPRLWKSTWITDPKKDTEDSRVKFKIERNNTFNNNKTSWK